MFTNYTGVLYVANLAPFIIYVFKDTYNININNLNMESDKEIISRLKFIGKIQKGEKINVKYMYVQPEGILTRISRSLIHQDNRQNTLNFVRSTISKTFDIIASYSSSNKESQLQLCTHIITDLKQSKNGLINLKDTYLDDIKFTCDIDTLLQDIDAKLVEIEIHNLKEDINELEK
jgi:hypothetical protein